jgi:hypothetical protein
MFRQRFGKWMVVRHEYQRAVSETAVRERIERGNACLQVSAERQSCHLCSIALCKSTKSIHQKSWNSSDASYLRGRESDRSLCALEVVSLDRSQSTSRLAKCRQRYTWKCLKGRGRSFLKLLSKVVRYEQVMYIALVREKVGIVRTNWRILVILDLFQVSSWKLFKSWGLMTYGLLESTRALEESSGTE